MADNNMNLNSSPEQELDLEQLEQVSGGTVLLRSTEPEPNESDLISSGIVPKANGEHADIFLDKVKGNGGGNAPEDRRRLRS
jgi:hypothetical protein